MLLAVLLARYPLRPVQAMLPSAHRSCFPQVLRQVRAALVARQSFPPDRVALVAICFCEPVRVPLLLVDRLR